MRKFICILVLIFILACSVSCGSNYTEKYVDYECIDANLTYIKAGREIGSFVVKDEASILSYHAIKGVSEDDFIVVDRSTLLSGSNIFIYQNPESEIYALRDWTVSEIQFYVSLLEGKFDFSRSNKQKIVFSSNGQEEIVSFLDCVDSDSIRGLRSSKIIKDSRFYMRVLFEEEKNMAWDAEICIVGDSYALVYKLPKGGVEYREISKESPLCELVEEAIRSTGEDHLITL